MRYFFILLLLPLFSHAQSIPQEAFKYRDILKYEIDKNFPFLPEYNYIPALIEHESCVSLKSKRCWSPTSRLLTSREEGAGFFQLTRTFRDDGSIRFDTVSELRNKYKSELRDLSWSNIYSRPDLQFRAGVLFIRDIYKNLYNIPEETRLHFTDAAYNGGLNGVLKERRACGLSSSCNPSLWFNHVERFCLKSKKILYGTRNACDINRYHVRDVFYNKLPKYQKFYFTKDYLTLEEENVKEKSKLHTQ